VGQGNSGSPTRGMRPPDGMFDRKEACSLAGPGKGEMADPVRAPSRIGRISCSVPDDPVGRRHCFSPAWWLSTTDPPVRGAVPLKRPDFAGCGDPWNPPIPENATPGFATASRANPSEHPGQKATPRPRSGAGVFRSGTAREVRQVTLRALRLLRDRAFLLQPRQRGCCVPPSPFRATRRGCGGSL